MKECPSCGEDTFMHMHGGMRCLTCDFQTGYRKGSHQSRRDERRYKRVLRRLDRIGARLANVRW
jgi:hypothetical protein